MNLTRLLQETPDRIQNICLRVNANFDQTLVFCILVELNIYINPVNQAGGGHVLNSVCLHAVKISQNVAVLFGRSLVKKCAWDNKKSDQASKKNRHTLITCSLSHEQTYHQASDMAIRSWKERRK